MSRQLSKIRSLFPIPCILILILGAISEKINPDLKATLTTKKEAQVIITFDVKTAQTLDAVRNKIRSTTNRAQKHQTIAQALEDQAKRSQAKALEIVKSAPTLKYRVLWITNQIYIYSATAELINKLEVINEVTQIDEDTLKIAEDPPPPESSLEKPKRVPHPKYGELTWGIESMQVPEVWSQGYFGQNVIVAHIDGGVELNDANRDNFVGTENFGWFAPSQDSPTPIPNGYHGTHTMGTIAGHNGIGVAPGARWMTCGYTWAYGYDGSLECLQHFLCPGGHQNGTKPCGMSPQVISNSWGIILDPPENIMDAFISTLHAFEEAGTFVVFAAGNRGPGCKTVYFPQKYPFIFDVGAYGFDNKVAHFSSSGPGSNESVIKPELVAPGVKTLSTGLNMKYTLADGTSMACPHVAGVVALMLSKNPTVTVAQIREALIKSTEPTVPEVRCSDLNCRTRRQISDPVCMKIPLNVFPNFRAGYGKLNALKAVNYIPAA